MAKRPNPDDESDAPGATAFVRLDKPNADDAPGATAFVQLDKGPPADDAPGATAFVRLDKDQLPLPPRRPAPNTAPKKGLQVQLPDDEPPPPKPKPKPVPAAAESSKSRRGAWWDEKSAPLGDDETTAPAEAPSDATEEQAAAEAPSDDAPGATAFLQAAPPPPPRPRAPVRAPEPAPAPPDDGRTQFFKPEQEVLDSDARQRPAPVAPPPEAAVPWKPLIIIFIVAFVLSMFTLVFVYRRELFHSQHKAKHTVEDTGTSGE